MRVSHLALTDYRSYKSAVVELSPGTTVLQGRNGRGKTNFVEAIAYLGTFSSHRGGSSANLVRISPDGEEQPGGAVIRAKIESEGHSDLVELEIARGRANRARLNRAKVSPREVLGVLRSVIFAPEDLNLLRGDPAGRRTFLDEIAVKLKPHHLGTLQDFQKVSRQRAAALKQLQKARFSAPEDVAVLDVWDEQISQLSAVIVAHRIAVVAAMRPHVMQAYADLTDEDRVAELDYVSRLNRDVLSVDLDPADFRVEEGQFVGDSNPLVSRLNTAYRQETAERRDLEILRGVNLVGAHRDDLGATLDSLPVKGFASHGEMWSMALTLRLAEAEVLKRDQSYPVLILDDVFAELDRNRRSGLIECIGRAEQAIITVAVPEDVPAELHARAFEVLRSEDGSTHIREATDQPSGEEQGD
ncbi:MAG: DNA replication/repair protein RecF [Scrofimicrobium sp.]